jgi:DUF2075 family protein
VIDMALMEPRKEGLSWAYYSAPISKFVHDQNGCLAELAKYGAAEGSVEGPQMGAWEAQIECLQKSILGIDGKILLEFVVPRIGSRIDAVLLLEQAVVVLEFKVATEKKKELGQEGYQQVWDYALDLKNFHKASHDLEVVPILVGRQIRRADNKLTERADDGVYRPIRTDFEGLRAVLKKINCEVKGKRIDAESWEKASYLPTPSIVEAAQAVFSSNAVDNILLNEAKENLGKTFKTLERIITKAEKTGEKIICFVTGVPGAGKTLVGMQVAAKRRAKANLTRATFLSGNVPLVEVLTEALVRDRVHQFKKTGERVKKERIRNEVKPLIMHKMHFRDAGLRDQNRAPAEHIVIFDEAQRAWNMQQTRNFMFKKRKREMRKLGLSDFPFSEPLFLMNYMDRHQGWAVVICLVGGGQEIHNGEAGIGEWLRTTLIAFRHWRVFISPNLRESEFGAGQELRAIKGHGKLVLDAKLHLEVSNRSFRADKVSLFVRALLDGEEKLARQTIDGFAGVYPIRLTRDMGKAKEWIRNQARGSQRYGMLASSSAHRLKPDAVNVKGSINAVHWFLNGPDDTRSSYYLEDAATEFQVQGLEVDWALVAWDGDFRRMGKHWDHKSFKGSKWQQVKKEEHQRYLKNTYRVLLTRARQGMVIYVPKGESWDVTRNPEYYNGTFDYLKGLGIPLLN